MSCIFNACAQEKHEQHKKNTTTETKSDNKQALDESAAKSSIEEIIEHYLQIKNALVSDNSKEAAVAGKKMFEAINKFDKSALTVKQKEIYIEIEEDAKEHAEHIGENAENIEHQREHFDILSNDMYDLIKVFGSKQVLYVDFCPMYNNKGAKWLSESKTIKNPYYGRKMPSCGSVKEEIGSNK